MNKRTILIAVRLAISLLTLGALSAQLIVHVRSEFSVVNSFSYFTNLSNLFAAVVMLIGAAYPIQHRDPNPTQDLVRGSSVAGMVVVGIVFSILLRGHDLGSLMPWVNTVTHYVMPIAVALDWLYQPPKSSLALSQVQYWLIFPLIYLVYTLVRGAIVGWYPYPFLNPANVGGYGGVLLYSLAIIVLFLVISWVLMTLSNTLRLKIAQPVVSLWDISDESSADLMSRLYRAMLKEQKTPAAALRTAQRGLGRNQIRWTCRLGDRV